VGEDFWCVSACFICIAESRGDAPLGGGISMIVDPTGTMHLATSLYSKTRFVSDIFLRSETTFYVKYGDIIAQLCLAISVMLLVAAVLQTKKEKRISNGLY
jgi:apolipoprotein N-acyltransferase